MDSYLNIRVLPDSSISAPSLLNNLFSRFHRTMARHYNGQVAVGFPHYGQNGQKHYRQKTLGDVLRLFASKAVLEQLMGFHWLKGLRDHTQVGDIRPIPGAVQGYRTVSRVQKKSPQNMRKRSIAKGWLGERDAQNRIPDQRFKPLDLPYLQLQSLSNKQFMRIYVQLGELRDQPELGAFSSYGLSRTATIPWF